MYSSDHNRNIDRQKYINQLVRIPNEKTPYTQQLAINQLAWTFFSVASECRGQVNKESLLK